MEFSASADIAASPEEVWAILEQPGEYPAFDPFCERIEGQLAPGARLTVYSKLSPGRAFPIRVQKIVPNRRMVWVGGMPLGLFRGVRTYTLEPAGPKRTRFALREVFSGPMLPLMRRVLPDMTESFQAFAAGLKERAEARVTRT